MAGINWLNNADDCVCLAERNALTDLKAWLQQHPILFEWAEVLAQQSRVPVGRALRSCLGDPHRFLDSHEATRFAIEIGRREALVNALVCKTVRALLDELVGPGASATNREDYRILQCLYRDRMSISAIARKLCIPPGAARARVHDTYTRWQNRVRVFAGTALGDRDFPLPEALREPRVVPVG